MAFVTCAICKKEGSSHNMEHCDRCNLWVHLICAWGGESSSASCPSCGRQMGSLPQKPSARP